MAKSKEKKANSSELLTALLYIVVGILFCIKQDAMIDILLTIAGVVLIVKGVLDIVAKRVASGVIAAVAGLAMLLLGWVFKSIIHIAIVIFGIVILIKAIQNIFEILKRKYTVLEMVGAILAAVIGVLLIFNGWGMVNWVFILVGIALILDGAIALIKELQK